MTQPEFDQLKTSEDSGRGREIAGLLALPDLSGKDDRNSFHHRVPALALEAFRCEQITLAKVRELAALLLMAPQEVDHLLDQAGFLDHGPADVLIPGFSRLNGRPYPL